MMFSSKDKCFPQKSQYKSGSNASMDSRNIPLLLLQSKQYTSYIFSKNPCVFSSSKISYANLISIATLDFRCPGYT